MSVRLTDLKRPFIVTSVAADTVEETIRQKLYEP